jgi:phospholipid/cholesterol/gamma-HCH transport system substrate-binding protein
MIDRRHVAIGLAALAAVAAFAVWIVGGITGRVAARFPVTVTFARVGQLLRVTGDVKMRGVIVGRVARIEHLADGTARVTLAIDPGQRIPRGVSAAIRGKTLFGEKYVELVDPPVPSEDVLRPGDRIPESRTVAPFELEDVLRSLAPVLDAASPGDVGRALHALAQGLAGQEEEAGRAIDDGLAALRGIAAAAPDLDRLLAGADEAAAALARAAPDLTGTAAELDRLSRTLAADREDLVALLGDAPAWLDVVAAIVAARYDDLVDLSVKGADILDLVASHREALPGTVDALRRFTEAWVTNMSTPCRALGGRTVEADNPGSTCWQVWILTAEKDREPGGYGAADRPRPGPAAARAAYRAQLRGLLRLPFGAEPSDLAVLLHEPIRDARGLIPEGLE